MRRRWARTQVGSGHAGACAGGHAETGGHARGGQADKATSAQRVYSYRTSYMIPVCTTTSIKHGVNACDRYQVLYSCTWYHVPVHIRYRYGIHRMYYIIILYDLYTYTIIMRPATFSMDSIL